MYQHKDILAQLCPLELGGMHEVDQAVQGRALDAARQRIDDLLHEMFPDNTSELIDRWEARYGITTNLAEPLQLRRDRVVARKRSRGGLSKPFFIALAVTLGYTVTIDEAVDGDRYKWRVTVSNVPVYNFRAGESEAGDALLEWQDQTGLEGIFQELKPADTQVIFAYA